MAGERVLIVDDNPANLKLTRVILSGGGFDTDTAGNAEEAQAKIAARRPDAILMDVQLPGMDGLSLTRLLKAAPATRGIVVVALTAYAMKGDDDRAREAGCDGYIAKPIDTRALPKQLAELLGRPQILILEDDPAFGKLLRIELSRYGFRALLFNDAADAQAAIAGRRPDLFILDRRIKPSTDGLAFCHGLKDAAATKDVPVILLTGSELPDVRETEKQGGPDLYLLKSPDTLAALESHVRSLLSKRAA
ncbi:MAG: response regulator [Elusimicrobia bacterium]|nr:response regulator [Elusimicrobiota bacterium]